VRQALARMNLVVVVDQFLTDTARFAHYVLPAKTMFEEEDLVTAYWHPYLQRRAKVSEPPGEVRTETAIWRALCERLSFETRYFPQTDDAISTLLRGVLPGDITLDALTSGAVDCGSRDGVAFADRAFPTPSGKVEFSSDAAAQLWGVDPVPDYQPLGEGHASPLAARYPLQLLSCKTRDRIHSQFGNLDWIRDVERPHRLDIHPLDATARGLRDGDRAVVWNDRGRIEIDVRLDEGLRPGVVHILEGRCHDGDPDVNVLTDAGVTDMNHGATFYECLVEVAVVGTDDGRSMTHVGRSDMSVGADERRSVTHVGRRDTSVGTDARRSEDHVGRSEVAVGADGRRGFVLDLGRCVGCGACVLACRLENCWPGAAPWRRILPLNLRRRPGGPTYTLSVACHHCDRPACLAACPSRAYTKRDDGVVVHHEERCVGCRYCEMACPFGAPAYIAERGVMSKCHLCHHRLDRAELPACVAACPVEALRLSSGGEGGTFDARAVPGFVDPAGCGPNLRLIEPRNPRRAALLAALRVRLGVGGR
jgi:Fe-S-cluster-containing dehydrogenase component